MEKNKDIYYFSGTHWDREWYQNFQVFRFRLVNMLNELVEDMEKNSELGVFHMDGQTITLEDYAEINPDGAERLKALIEKNRIKIGPWYVMPDEFNLSGESLIRNLMMGHKLSKKWGAEDAWKFGYICDIFGHIAQMPQIFNGFGIKYSLFCRGAGKTDPYFIWQSPDGSECINFRIGDKNGYGEYYINVLMDEKTKELNENIDEIEKKNKDFTEFLFSLTDIPVYILMDANDHAGMHAASPEYIKQLERLFPDARVHQTDLLEAARQLEKYRNRMAIIKGEMNKCMNDTFGPIISNTLSSYYTIKKANDECQSLLEKVIEPMQVMSMLTNGDNKKAYVDLAYRHLIQNHPHDSICGCSLTQVHKDMEYRFDQVREIYDALEKDFMWKNQRPYLMDSDEYETNGVLTIYNTLPYERNGVVEADLLMKRDYPYTYAEPFGYEFINSFHIIDGFGNEIPYQIVDIYKNNYNRVKDQFGKKIDKYRVAFIADIPAFGKAEFKIVPSKKPSRYLNHMDAGDNYMENEFICVTITPNGELDIYDKKTGRIYQNQLRLIDDSEIGDGWYHVSCNEDRIINSQALSATVEKTSCGLFRSSFRITKDLFLPEEICKNESKICRSDKTVVCRAVFDISLDVNSRAVDIKLKLDNKAKDHRLRLSVPTYTKGDTYFAGQAFYCCERKTSINRECGEWFEPEVREKAMNGIVGKRDIDGIGLAFVSGSGLHECATMEDKNDTIDVTLLRAFRTTVAKNNTETACQLNQILEYSFSLMPLDREVKYTDLVKKQELLSTELITGYREVKNETEIIKPESYLNISGESVCTSIIKCAEIGERAVVVRIFNASDKETDAKICFFKKIKNAEKVNLNENIICSDDIAVKGDALCIKLGKWEIATVKVFI